MSTRPRMRRGAAGTAPLLALALSLLLAACSSNNKVGNDALLNIKQQAQGNFDATTTTTAPSGLAQGHAAAATTAPPTTARHTSTKATTPTTSAAQYAAAVIQITINSDGSQSQFNPSAQQAYPGSPIQWTNKDSVARSVVSDDPGVFNSGPLAPGASFTWTVWSRIGRINYHDGTRPYAVADVDVVRQP